MTIQRPLAVLEDVEELAVYGNGVRESADETEGHCVHHCVQHLRSGRDVGEFVTVPPQTVRATNAFVDEVIQAVVFGD